MNFNKIKDVVLWLSFAFTVIFIILQIKSCGKIDNSNYKKEKQILKAKIDSLNSEINVLFKKGDSLKVVANNKKTVILKGKERIKILESKVVIVDTIVLEYTQAMKSQLLEYDTLVSIKDSIIVNQSNIIAKKDSVIDKHDDMLFLSQIEIAKLEDDNSNKARKIKSLKLQRIFYPVVVLAGTIYFLISFK